MKYIRAFANVFYYYAFVVLAYQLALWINPLALETSGGRLGIFIFCLVATAIFGFISEIHEEVQGLRADLMDFIFGEG